MLNATFQREFAKLNEAQRRAVETIEGPVMVIAGPGSGKTQVLAMRIGQILSKTQATPRNILALTFTDPGVVALQERLVALIGPDAYRVTINTFHGFANEIIATFPYAFPVTAGGVQLSELERYRLLDELIVGNRKLKFLRPKRLSHFHVKGVASAIETLKQEAISADDLRRLAGRQFNYDKRSAQTAVKREAVEKTYHINLELADVYEQYQRCLRERGEYDYEDMIIFVLEALKNEPDIRSYLQERYQYILVDEYQDTNNAQNQLVERLSDFFVSPNLFVVGDDKQAIYRFQGASVANMLHFNKKYEELKVIALRDNYRNPRAVLAVASQIISRNHQQLANKLKGVDTTLRPISRHQTKVRLVAADNIEGQAIFIVRTIKKLIKDGALPQEIAVLLRTNDEVANFREILERFDIPVAGSANVNLIFSPPVQRLLSVLRAVANPKDSLAVLSALTVVDCKVSVFDVIRAGAEHHRHSLLERLLDGRDAVSRAARILSVWQRRLSTHGLLATVHQIVAESDLVNVYETAGERLDTLEILRSLLEEIRRFCLRHPMASVRELLDYIELLRLYGVRLPMAKLRPETYGVFVRTAHGAKGLEFDHVIMPNVSTDHWRLKREKPYIKLPGEITGLRHWHDDPLEDERRLFYVAMTRARRELIFCYARQNTEGKAVLPCLFVEEGGSEIKRETFSIPPDEVAETVRPVITAAAPSLATDHLRFIRETVVARPFSFTHFRAYRLCPRQYLLRSVLRFPTPDNANLVFGVAVHKAMEGFFKRYRIQKVLPPKQFLLAAFGESLRGDLPADELDILRERGEFLLERYYEKLAPTWTVPVGVEYSFTPHRVTLGDIWLTGKFDRIDLIDPIANTVRIVDYKTGSLAKTRGQIEGTTKDSDGEIKQQLVFYALLAKLDRHFPWRPVEFQVSFIDDKASFRVENFRISEEEIKQLGEDITATYHQILTSKSFEHIRDSFDRGCELCALFTDL